MRTTHLTAAVLGLAALSGTSFAQDLVISEIIDGTLPGGLPKAVELTNHSGGTIDLSNYTIGNFNNGGTTLGGGISLALSGMLGAGESYVISYEAGDSPGVGVFFDTYGCDPDNFDQGAFFNGDDAIVLFNADGTGPLGEANGDGSDATIHDIYGEIGVNGDGTAWDYTDGYSQRNNTAASATWNAADWTVGGLDSLEAGCMGDDVCEAMNHVTLTNPTPQGGCGGPPSGFADSCNGDGGDQMGCTDCPCGNNASPGTVGGCLNSGGTSSRLLGSGTGSIAAADLRFEASGVAPSNSCVLTSGNALAPAQMANPCFGLNTGIQSVSLDGLRCSVQGVLRHGVRPSDANGDVGVTTNGWGDPNGFFNFSAFMAGQEKHFQIIHRDDVALICMTGQNTSQASTVMFSM